MDTAKLLGVMGYFMLMASAFFFLMGWKKLPTKPVAGRRWLIGGMAVAAFAVTLLGMAL